MVVLTHPAAVGQRREGSGVADLLFGGEEGRAGSAEQADLAELREDDSHVQVEQAEAADDNEGAIEHEADDSIAGWPGLLVLLPRSCHRRVHGSCTADTHSHETDFIIYCFGIGLSSLLVCMV